MLRPSTGTTTTSSSSTSSRKSPATRGISTLPFPTLPPAISSRPLPLPPTTHALLRSSSMTTEFHFATKRARKSSLSPLSKPPPAAPAPPAPSMQRRRSRDPNVADRLVVELDDDQHTHSIHPRPSSPSPDSIPTSPDPPAYSTLPPPYSATTEEKKKDGFTIVVEDDQPVLPPPKPCNPPSSSSASSSSHKRSSRVSASELRVLVYLYRTVVYGLEMRNRKEKDSDLLDPPLPTAAPVKKKPLGPRSSRTASPSPSPSSLPEEMSHFEKALAKAAASKTAAAGGFAHFPLVEDDLDSPPKEYTTPSTPFHSPSQSPKSSHTLLRPCPSLDQLSTQFSPNPKPTTKKEKTKAEINAELHVQDALLALRLKEFLRAQGVCEDDLRVDFDEEGRAVEPLPLPQPMPEKEKKVEECKDLLPVQEEADDDDEENNILDEYFMGIEEEEDSATKNKNRGPVVEDDVDSSPFVEQDDSDVDPSPSPPPPPPTLQLAPAPAPGALSQRISSPPPPTSPSPRPHAVLPTSYMVALLTMRVRHPSKKPGSSSSGGTGTGTGNAGGNSSNGNGTGSGNGSGTGTHDKLKVKRKSGLSVLVEVD